MATLTEYPEESLQVAQTFSIHKPADVFLPVKGEQYEILDRGLVVPIVKVLTVALAATDPDGAIVTMFSVYRGF